MSDNELTSRLKKMFSDNAESAKNYFATKDEVSGDLNNYYTKSAVNALLSNKQNRVVFETKSILTTDWIALADSSPYTYSATVTATATISSNTVVELINDNPLLFATYGFAIAGVSGQTITIYSIGLPSADCSLKIGIGD